MDKRKGLDIKLIYEHYLKHRSQQHVSSVWYIHPFNNRLICSVLDLMHQISYIWAEESRYPNCKQYPENIGIIEKNSKCF